MNKKFDIEFLPGVIDFFDDLEENERNKIIYNLDKAKYSNDPKLFKKLESDIWEFRTRYNKKQFRLLAFWDKRDNLETLVIASNGFIKTTKKVPKKEIDKAKKLMKEYFENDD